MLLPCRGGVSAILMLSLELALIITADTAFIWWAFTWAIIVLAIGSVSVWSTSPMSEYCLSDMALPSVSLSDLSSICSRSRLCSYSSSMRSRSTSLLGPTLSPSMASAFLLGILVGFPPDVASEMHRHATKSVIGEVVTAFNCLPGSVVYPDRE